MSTVLDRQISEAAFQAQVMHLAALSERGGIVAEARSWGEVFALVTGEAPI